MSTNNDVNITLELFNFSKLKNCKITDNKTTLIVQGNDYCKTYDKIKDINLIKTENTINVCTTLSNLKKKLSLSNKTKIIKLLNDSVCYNKDKYATNLLNLFINNKTIENSQLDATMTTKQQEIKNKNYTTFSQDYCSELLEISNDFVLKTNNNLNFSIEAKSCNQVYKKSNGCVVFDSSLLSMNFSNDFIIIKNSNDIKMLKSKKTLKTKQVVLHNPTNNMFEQMLEILKNETTKPQFVWVVLPFNVSPNHCGFNINHLVSVLFWTSDNIILSSNSLESFCKDCSFVLNNNKDDNLINKEIKHEIVIEKVKYKLHESEKALLTEINLDNVSMLNKLYFYNLGETVPVEQFECNECVICCEDFLINPHLKSYMPCGHSFCASCIIKSIKVRQCCPSCRHVTKFNGIIIPNIESNKMNTFIKIIKKIKKENTNNVTLIYTETFTLGKKITNYLNSNKIAQSCFITQDNIDDINVANTAKQTNPKVLVCSIDKDNYSQNIKNISNIIILTSGQDIALKTESLGYDYCNGKAGIKIWLLLCADLQ